jgi:hypothetical protein
MEHDSLGSGALPSPRPTLAAHDVRRDAERRQLPSRCHFRLVAEGLDDAEMAVGSSHDRDDVALRRPSPTTVHRAERAVDSGSLSRRSGG